MGCNRDLTHELNNVVEEIEMRENNDDKITLLFSEGVILEDIKKLIKGNPVTLYNIANEQTYLFYKDGTRK